jgi:hypothetical protein
VSIVRGQSWNVENEIVKKQLDGEGFLYTSFRGKDTVFDVNRGIKIRGVFLTLKGCGLGLL